jgi:hypothetical protein
MSDLQQTLRDLHRELGQAERLAPEDRAMLEAALGDIQRALQSTPGAAGAVEPPGDALEGAAATVRSLIDALSKAGI